MKIYSFPYIANENSKILILGTMPGIRSLELNQYYGHGQNAFWKILFELFDVPFSKDYEARKQLLLNNGIALWDVLQHCYREGSADSAIKDEYANDIACFLVEHPSVKTIFFNGKKAKSLYEKYIGNTSELTYYDLPSTSPANARFSYKDKLEKWKTIRQSV